jgi:uncharacterized protein YggT (Ycf19 family)
VINLIREIITLYVWVIIIASLLSWFPSTNSSGGLAATKRVLHTVTEPFLRPIRQIMPRPRVGGVGVDFSALVAIVVLDLIARFI